MKRLLSEKSLVLVLFVCALVIFSIANEDAKKSGLLQNSTSIPSPLLSAANEKQSLKTDQPIIILDSEKE